MARVVKAGLSDPQLASELLDSFDGAGLQDIDDAIRSHFHYRPEAEELLRTIPLMWGDWIRRGFFEGDCDDVSMMWAAIAGALGFPVRFVAIRYNADVFEHVFVEVFDGWRWRIFDPTVTRGTVYGELERMVQPL